MSNLDETKVKVLLKSVVDDIFTCLPANTYIDDVKRAVQKKIFEADLRENVIKLFVPAEPVLTDPDDDDSVQPMSPDWS